MRRARLLDVVFVATMVGVVAGCATVSFKRGAGPESMSVDEKACRASTSDEDGFLQCMRDRGWYIAVTKPAPGGGLEVEEPTGLAPAEPVTPALAAVVPTPKATQAVAAPTTIAPTPASIDPAAATPVAVVPAPASIGAAAVAPAAPDSLPRVRVSSWWKLGGTAADLDRSIAACVAQLGEPHKPDANATVVTVALQSCLRQAGWYSFGGS